MDSIIYLLALPTWEEMALWQGKGMSSNSGVLSIFSSFQAMSDSCLFSVTRWAWALSDAGEAF
jgi:hypothetical protein